MRNEKLVKSTSTTFLEILVRCLDAAPAFAGDIPVHSNRIRKSLAASCAARTKESSVSAGEWSFAKQSSPTDTPRKIFSHDSEIDSEAGESSLCAERWNATGCNSCARGRISVESHSCLLLLLTRYLGPAQFVVRPTDAFCSPVMVERSLEIRMCSCMHVSSQWRQQFPISRPNHGTSSCLVLSSARAVLGCSFAESSWRSTCWPGIR